MAYRQFSNYYIPEPKPEKHKCKLPPTLGERNLLTATRFVSKGALFECPACKIWWVYGRAMGIGWRWRPIRPINVVAWRNVNRLIKSLPKPEPLEAE